MSVLRPYRLEREVDSAFYHWLAWLPHWHPSASRRRSVCQACPRYVDALGLDDLPHAPLHGLFGAADRLLGEQFAREFDAQYPSVRVQGEWTASLEDGRVVVRSVYGESLDDILERTEHGVLQPVPTALPPHAMADIRTTAERTHRSLFEAVIARLGVQRTLVLRALDAHVEPKIRLLADELIAELSADRG